MSNEYTHIYSKIRAILLRCSEFNTDLELRSIFVDTRISQWRDIIPGANSRMSRVLAVIYELHNRYNAHQTNALVLLLRVLSELNSENDGLHQELFAIANEFESVYIKNLLS